MSDRPFGAPGGLLQRLSRAAVHVDDVREAAEALAATGVPGLTLAVVDAGQGPLLLLEEAGRATRVQLAGLAAEMTRARVAGTPDGVAAALASWLTSRPVPDAAAASAGIAVLDWTDAGATTLGWRVVVVRDASVVPWRPGPTATVSEVHRIRSAALGRAATVPVEVRVTGPVAVWTHAAVPGLDTAVLVRPEELLRATAEAGLPLRDAHLVVTPSRPVACAEPRVARRLAVEGTEPCRTLPWRTLTDLRWA